ncbi:glycerophosphodiester phosphodiesterase [Saccharomonospora piscinae]|uniref:Glycerophosphodiester phosphodiesterase n=1 Tax=Saccharomonospora piscinae TaxID=687388 RepID=A0A1V9A0F5_SACPI|nr:glycerophosphodiester phosphodiesterase family protein [Saccharomonospora piscinae]OQO90632.1 glycerophosphodiester phosphodiesterase [Saccharomonospora piscinae]TLW93297.1 glycerophosphodiester phosphodiesterase [Saccharomonospora piscinae]
MTRRHGRLALVTTLVALLTAGLAAPAAAGPPRGPKHFDIQAHRGGLGLTVEGTLAAFSRALELGVTTLELDIQITRDGRDVITHDRQISAAKCRDTKPASPGDPQFPYVGSYVKDLTFAQVRTLDCGSLRQPGHPDQELAPGATMPTLAELFDLVREHRAHRVRFNIETKVEAAAPEETAPREQFVDRVIREVSRSGFARNVTVQSFDWGALMQVRRKAPWLPVVALTQPEFLQVGAPGRSPWLGGLDIDDFGGDPVAAVSSFGASALSPVHGNPQGGTVGDDDYVPFTTRELVDDAHAAGLRVVPWTVNDRATMHKLIDDGVDGLITDYPDRLREVAAERGFRPPKPSPLRGRDG